QQYQGVRGAEATHAEGRGRAGVGTGRLTGRAVGVVDVVAQEVGDGQLTGDFDVLPADYGDRVRAFDFGALDARTGHFDAIEVGCRVLGGSHGWAAGGGDKRNGHRVTPLVGLT